MAVWYRVRFGWLFFFLAAALLQLQAQTPADGAIRGLVLDEASAAVAGATIRVEDSARGLVFHAFSNAQGEFFFMHLPAGIYNAKISAPGFTAAILSSVVSEVGGITDINLRLRIANPQTNITVLSGRAEEGNSSVSIDESSGTAVANIVDTTELESLPVNGRHWQSFASLTPAANLEGQSGDLLSFRGLSVSQNTTTIDGMSNDQTFKGVPRGTENGENDRAEETGVEPGGARRSAASWRRSGAAYTFSQQAVREFRVSTQNYSALYGHGAGGAIATISKSGTNDLHGSSFYIVRSSGWAATNPFSIATSYRDGLVTSRALKPHDLLQQFGGTIGGAVVQNRLFYFYAFDQQRRGFPAIGAPGDPSFYNLTLTQKALLANRGVTTTKVNAALNYLSGLTGETNRRDDQTISFAKLDWQISAKNRLSAQYNRLRSASPAGLRGAPVVDRARASLGSGYAKVDAASMRWTWTATHFANELRFAYGRDLQYEQAQTPLPEEPAIGLGGYAPEITIDPNGLTFGTPAGVGRTAYPNESRRQVVDTATWGFGRHLLQAGFDLSFLHDEISGLNNAVGTFHYDSGTTNGHAGGLVDWITDYTFNVNAYPNGGCPSIQSPVHYFCFRSFTQSFGEQKVSFRTQEWAAYLQDSWHIASNLTLNAGLRYEYVLFPLPQHPNAVLDSVFDDIGATGILPEDRNNFGPRIGAAWAPFGLRHGIVRLGYGVYYGRVPGTLIQSALVNTAQNSSATHIRITPTTITSCPQVANQGFGYVCTYVATPPAAISSTTAATVFSKRFRSPMVQQGTLSYEQSIGNGVVASATYLMNIDRQLAGAVDANIAPSTETRVFQIQGGSGAAGLQDGQFFIVPMYTIRRSNDYGPVTAITSNIAASYNALTMEARRRHRHGLEFRAAWTWSKAIDQGQNAGATPRSNSQFDPFTVSYDKGLSRLNFPHKIVVSAIWEPRVKIVNRFVSHVANGWALSGIFYETSGRPYSYEIFGGTRLSGGRESINGSGGAVYLPTIGRNTLRLPDTNRMDLRLARAFHAGEHLRIRAMLEAFNAMNHVNYTGIQQRAFLVGTPLANGVTPLIFQDAATIASEGLNVQPFGTYTASTVNTSRERQIQLSLKIDF